LFRRLVPRSRALTRLGVAVVHRSHRTDEQEFDQLLDRDGAIDDIYLFNES